MIVGVHLDPRWSSTTSKSAKSGNYEAFVMVFYCHFIIKLCFSRRGEQKISTLDNNKGFINLRFLQRMNCQKTEWDQARYPSLV